MKVPAVLLSGKGTLPGLQVAAILLHPYMAFLMCTYTPSVSSSFYKVTSSVGLGPALVTSFVFNYLPKGPFFKYS